MGLRCTDRHGKRLHLWWRLILQSFIVILFLQVESITRLPDQMESAIAKSVAKSGNSSADQAMQLNNEGVTALFQNDFDTAIKKLQQALSIDNHLDLAVRNLAIAYNRKGAREQIDKPERALTYFRYALYVDPANQIAKQNIDGVMRVLGMNAHSFEDHIKLAQKALAQADLRGAVVEYKLALAIKRDERIQKSLALLERKISSEKSKPNW